MTIKAILTGTAVAVALAMGSVQAAEKFATLGDVPAVKMTGAQTSEVRGTAHVRNMLGRIGVTVPSQAFDALGAAGSGSTPAGGPEVPVINGLF